MRKVLSVMLLLLLAVGMAFAVAPTPEGEEEVPTREIKNPDTFIWASIGDTDSLDPAKAYDTASWEIMTNIYEPLIFYAGASGDQFVPVLATEVPTVANGGIINDGKTYRFRIRKGVKFHNGNDLTPEDVEYTFERNMIVDADGGPNWVWYTYLLGLGGSGDIDDFSQIDEARNRARSRGMVYTSTATGPG